MELRYLNFDKLVEWPRDDPRGGRWLNLWRVGLGLAYWDVGHERRGAARNLPAHRVPVWLGWWGQELWLRVVPLHAWLLLILATVRLLWWIVVWLLLRVALRCLALEALVGLVMYV